MNMMNSAHKASTDAYREGWDRIFGGPPVVKACNNCKHFSTCMNYDPWNQRFATCEFRSNWEAQ